MDIASGVRDAVIAKTVAGGLLVQDADLADLEESKLWSSQSASPGLSGRTSFCLKAAKHVKSNAIVLCKGRHASASGRGR